MVSDAARPGPRPARALLPLSALALAAGVSGAIVVPFLSLFLSTAVGAGPVQITVFLLLSPVAGVAWSLVVGRLSDRPGARRTVLALTSLGGLAGMAATAFVRDYWIVLALGVTVAPLANTLYAQMFAYARQTLTGDGADGGRTAFAISVVRTVFSLAWVVGPPLATVLLAAGGFRSVYGGAALLYAAAALVALGWLSEPPPLAPDPDEPAGPTGPAPAAPRSALLLAMAAFAFAQCPLTLGVQTLPLFISTELHRNVSSSGLLLGLCAALEIPLMLGLGALALRVRLRVLVMCGIGCGVAYYALAAVATQVWMLAAGQLLNAAFIAGVSALGITYMQDMLPREPGRASTLFSNTYTVGAILAGPLLGLARQFGYRLSFASCALLCLAGLLVLLPARTPVRPAQPAPHPVGHRAG